MRTLSQWIAERAFKLAYEKWARLGKPYSAVYGEYTLMEHYRLEARKVGVICDRETGEVTYNAQK
jgi:hypothetical protein